MKSTIVYLILAGAGIPAHADITFQQLKTMYDGVVKQQGQINSAAASLASVCPAEEKAFTAFDTANAQYLATTHQDLASAQATLKTLQTSAGVLSNTIKSEKAIVAKDTGEVAADNLLLTGDINKVKSALAQQNTKLSSDQGALTSLINAACPSTLSGINLILCIFQQIDTNPKVQSLMATIASDQAMVNKLTKELANESEIPGVAGLQEEIAKLSAEITKTNATLATNTASLTTLEGKITAQKTKVDDLQKAYSEDTLPVVAQSVPCRKLGL